MGSLSLPLYARVTICQESGSWSLVVPPGTPTLSHTVSTQLLRQISDIEDSCSQLVINNADSSRLRTIQTAGVHIHKVSLNLNLVSVIGSIT